MASRLAWLTFTALLVAVGSVLTPAITLQNAQRPGDIELPPITFLCPMNGAIMADGSIHADVFEDKTGTCPICKMNLVATRLDSIWTCPVHSIIHEKNGGLCPIDKRELVRVTVAVTFTCAANPEIDQITPAKCPDGSAMTAKYTPRAHGNHNPQHGGQFFMAPDNWTHVEGTLPRAGQVRIYFYDDYTKPLPPDKFKAVQGRIITTSTVGGTPRETSVPLVRARTGTYMDAKVDSRALPTSMVAKIQVKEGGPEYHFDFTFNELSKEPPAAPAAGAVVKAATPATPPSTRPPTGTPASAAAAAAPAQTLASAPPATPAQPPAPSAAQQPAAGQMPAPVAAAASKDVVPLMVNPALINVVIPATTAEIVAQIGSRNRQIRELVDAGKFADVWLPAFEAKELALAMNGHGAEMPTYKRKLLDPTIKQLLHAAWMLDAFGDIGNREQLTAAYGDFSSAVSAIESLMGAQQQ